MGYFIVLKRAYSQLFKSKIHVRINYIDKLDFPKTYLSARIKAFKSESLKNSFAAASLVSYKPDRVILKLDIYLRTPTPLLSRESE
jgi:hypothetical protein